MERASWEEPWLEREESSQLTVTWFIFRPYSLLVLQSSARASHRPTQLVGKYKRACSSASQGTKMRDGWKVNVGGQVEDMQSSWSLKYPWWRKHDRQSSPTREAYILVEVIENNGGLQWGQKREGKLTRLKTAVIGGRGSRLGSIVIQGCSEEARPQLSLW